MLILKVFFLAISFFNLIPLNKNFKKGVGVLLIFLFIPDIFLYPTNDYIWIFIFINFFSIIYFIDDFKGLSAVFRIFLQIVTGLLFIYHFNLDNYFIIFITLIIFVILVNFINFQDGLDLNIALYLALFLISNYLYANSSINHLSLVININILIFLIFFIYFNLRHNFYFGDSGSFIFACLIFISSLDNSTLNQFIMIFNLIIFPVIDSTYVTLLRIRRKENLLSRNFYHLYHVVHKKFYGFYYLIPPILNFIILFIFYSYSKEITYITFLISTILTISNYFFIRILVKWL